MDDFNDQNNGFGFNGGSGDNNNNNNGVNLNKDNSYQGSQDYRGFSQNPQNPQNYQNPNDGGRVAYGQPGQVYQNDGYNPSRSGYTDPQTGYNQNGYNQAGYNQTGYNQNGYNQTGYNQNGYNGGYNQNNYDMNDPNNYQYGYNAYQDPYSGFQRTPSQGIAIASLVLGILGMSAGLFGWIFPLLFLAPIAGLVCGIIHKVKYPGFAKGLSTAGIILSVIGIILPFVIIILAISALPEMMQYVKEMDPETYEEMYQQYGEEFPGWFSAAFAMVKSLIIK